MKSEPSTRLLEYWTAPRDAGEPVGLLATTFSFEPDFFELDCLGRFADLDGRPGEGDRWSELTYRLDLEERLARMRASVLVDRSYHSIEHSFRWDVIPVGVRGGLLHAKVALLVWDQRVRLIVGSANLTRAGYRSQVEAAVVLDAFEETEVPRPLFLEGLAALDSLISRAEESGAAVEPLDRAKATLRSARARVEELCQRKTFPGRLRAKLALSGAGETALAALDSVWVGSRPLDATVVSPFFDTDDDGNRPATELLARLRGQGEKTATFVVPVDKGDAHAVVRAPASLRSALQKKCDAQFFAFRPPEEKESHRRLHAKGLLLEGNDWIAAMLGSSNFTSKGLGLDGRSHLEVNVWWGAPEGSPECATLRKLFFDVYDEDEPIPDSGMRWEPAADDEEEPAVVLPWGFRSALFDPTEPPRVLIRLAQEELPADWAIRRPTGELLVESATWRDQGQPQEISVALPAGTSLFVLRVEWATAAGNVHAFWPLNVTDPSLLPPPEELRHLSSDQILRALAATRPLTEALVQIVREAQESPGALAGDAYLDELDPLKRYSNTGQLLARTREFSKALVGLRRYLEKPVYSLEALRWRLVSSPCGPAALARALTRESEAGTGIPGETEFRLAELARELATIRWRDLAQDLNDPRAAEVQVRGLLAEITVFPIRDGLDDELRRYVEAALAEVRR